jgi:hypothetical protein
MFQIQGDGEITYHEHQTLDSAREIFEALKNKARPAEEEQTL